MVHTSYEIGRCWLENRWSKRSLILGKLGRVKCWRSARRVLGQVFISSRIRKGVWVFCGLQLVSLGNCKIYQDQISCGILLALSIFIHGNPHPARCASACERPSHSTRFRDSSRAIINLAAESWTRCVLRGFMVGMFIWSNYIQVI